MQSPRPKHCAVVLTASACLAIPCAPAGEWTVTGTRPSGPGSLRAAVEAAEAERGPSRVVFRLAEDDPGRDRATGVWLIRIAEPLPPLASGGTEIDAADGQRGRNGEAPRVALVADGPNVEHGLCLASSGNAVRGLAVGGFRHGIVLYGAAATRNTVEENWVGAPLPGVAAPNETGVVLTEGARQNLIARNVLSGNGRIGLFVGGRETGANRVTGNRIGCDPTGCRGAPNGIGIMVARSADNRIGGPAKDEGNQIAGNADVGILLVGKGTERNVIQGNTIGVDRSGRRPLSNNIGVVIKSLANGNSVGGAQPGEGNVISGNVQIGVYIEAADGNRLLGNRIGTDAAGLHAVRDGERVQGNGVEFNTVAKDNVVGGTRPGEGNVISGHSVYGIVYYGRCTRNATVGNQIGTDATGETALPNATGICVDCASHHNDIAYNTISGNQNYGLFFVTRGTEHNTLRGNRIGTNARGTAVVPNDIGLVVSTGASRNRIGGPAPGDANVIAGNRQAGVMITNRFTEENLLEANWIGVGADGTSPLPNGYGIILSTYPRHNRIAGNTVGFNRQAGVVLCEFAVSNAVTRNRLLGQPVSITQDATSVPNAVAENRLEEVRP